MSLIKIWIYSLAAVIIGLFVTFYLGGTMIILFGSTLITSNLLIVFILQILLSFLGPLITIGISYLLIRKKNGVQAAKSFLIRAIIILIIASVFLFPYLFGSWEYNVNRLKLSIQPALDLKENNDLETVNKSGDQLLENWANINEAEIINWQTYRNEKLGFEIKYPTNWTYEHKYPNSNQVGFYPSGKKPTPGSGSGVLPDIDFSEIKQAKVEYYLHSEMDRKKYKIGDIEIIKFIPRSKDSLLDTIVYLPDGKIYQVFVWSDARETFNKMLPTLKSIK